MIDTFEDLRTVLQTWVSDLENECLDDEEKNFIGLLNDRDQQIYKAGMKWGIKKVQNIIG
jgi:hypothetical protein